MPGPTKSLGPLDPQPAYDILPPWRTILLWLGLTLSIVVVGRIAFADGATIPERQASVCESLGYSNPDCEPRWEGKAVDGVLELVVDSHLGEPDYKCGTCHADTFPAQASAVILTTKAGTASQIYQQDFRRSTSWGPALLLAPCLTPICVEKRETDPNYSGPTENDLLDLAAVVSKALWQTGDEGIQSQLRRQHGKTGTPVIVKVDYDDADLGDETHTDLPSTATIPIKLRFALPAK